jgi:secondary thiamine-phosphate synthase enzyme
MSRSSVVTVREAPLTDVAATGEARVVAKTLTFNTGERFQVFDLTDRVMTVVRESGVVEGTVSLVSLHTTNALFINESQPALLADIEGLLEQIVARESAWRHNDPEYSDCDRFNADSHLRALLLGHTVTLQVSAGELVLGQWQRVLMAELDGPRVRSVRLMIMGLANVG